LTIIETAVVPYGARWSNNGVLQDNIITKGSIVHYDNIIEAAFVANLAIATNHCRSERNFVSQISTGKQDSLKVAANKRLLGDL